MQVAPHAIQIAQLHLQRRQKTWFQGGKRSSLRRIPTDLMDLNRIAAKFTTLLQRKMLRWQPKAGITHCLVWLPAAETETATSGHRTVGQCPRWYGSVIVPHMSLMNKYDWCWLKTYILPVSTTFSDFQIIRTTFWPAQLKRTKFGFETHWIHKNVQRLVTKVAVKLIGL